MAVRGVRGATVAAEDQTEAILSTTRELLEAMLRANPEMKSEDIASALFTVSGDLSAAYPAAAARQIGWVDVPLVCAQEIPVPGGLERCIRILIHWNTGLSQAEIHHIYLREAVRLRPDLQPGAARPE